MAREKPAADHASARPDGDSSQAFDAWIEQQREWMTAMLGAWTQQQQLATQLWFSWLDSLSAGAAALPQAGWPGLPQDLLTAGPRLVQTWWAPWAPFTQRGTEQLG